MLNFVIITASYFKYLPNSIPNLIIDTISHITIITNIIVITTIVTILIITIDL